MKVTAVTNQKGGVGKTTTAINLSANLAALDYRVLIVDLDPQGNASTGLGIDKGGREKSMYDVLIDDMLLDEVARSTLIDNLFIAPGTTDLSSVDVALAEEEGRVRVLRDALESLESEYDYVFLDCPPSMGLLTVNALVAADSVLIPLQTEFFALEGLSQLMLTVREIRDSANPELRFEGVVLTMHDARNNLSRQVEEDARDTLGDIVYQTKIPRNVRISEAPSFALPVGLYDPQSKGSLAYRDLAEEFLARRQHLGV